MKKICSFFMIKSKTSNGSDAGRSQKLEWVVFFGYNEIRM